MSARPVHEEGSATLEAPCNEAPARDGYRMPAEWEPHEATWLALPYRDDEWAGHLSQAREELLGLAVAIATVGEERVRLLVVDEALAAWARDRELPPRMALIEMPYGDCWTRDTAALGLVRDGARGGGRATVRFRFDGWGGKYVMGGDVELAERMARHLGLPAYALPFVLEGGAIDVDGEGTCLTTRDCLLRRLADRDEDSIARDLGQALGLESVIWLDGALENDHTDGHVDTLARFVAPGEVVCMEGAAGDPNGAMLEHLAEQLEASRDARGRALRVHRIPSPGIVKDDEGRLMPASYCNFYITNGAVFVPAYGSPSDAAARAAIAKLFPTRRTLSLPSFHVLVGGGAFHCATQQEPADLATSPDQASEHRDRRGGR